MSLRTFCHGIIIIMFFPIYFVIRTISLPCEGKASGEYPYRTIVPILYYTIGNCFFFLLWIFVSGRVSIYHASSTGIKKLLGCI